MDYKKKYKAALAIAKDCLKDGTITSTAIDYIRTIFPELAESEDERIRKELIEHCKNQAKPYIDIGNECPQIQSWIAWLEKQGSSSVKWQKNTPDNKPAINHSVLMKTTQGIVEGYFVGSLWFQFRWSSNIKDSDVLAWMELSDLDEQDGQKPVVVDFKAKDWYVSKVDGKIHDMTYNPTDKVEPKFKVGDWILYSGDHYEGVRHITKIDEDGYYIERNGLPHGIIPFNHEICMRLWTIQDAKEGDVLVDSLSGDNQITILFKCIELDTSIRAYCGWNCYNFRVTTDGTGYGTLSSTKYVPATKEQRDLLFQEMEKAGYEWDDEKKELKKIEQKYTVKPIFSIGDVLCDKSCTTLDKNSQPNIEVRDIRNDMYICNNCSFPISQQDEYELVAKRIELQPAWNDEDELVVSSIEGALEGYESMVSDDWKKEKEWLTSIKDRMQLQPKEWSEEDERMHRMCVDAVEYYHTPEDESAIREWIKSLKERITWKPSKKQMETLEYYMHTLLATEHKEALFGLYNDLKKL